jgi:hypothetical protein
LWVEFAALIGSAERPEFSPIHPWGCHRRRVPDRAVFDHVIAALVHGSGYERFASKGNPYLKGVLGEAAAAAAKTNTFLGERYRRLVKRRGKLKALVAVARSILVIVWHLLSDPTARFHDLGPDYHTTRIDTTRKIRNHISQLTALGFRVTLEPAA